MVSSDNKYCCVCIFAALLFWCISFQIMEQVDSWKFNVFELESQTNNRPLAAITYTILRVIYDYQVWENTEAAICRCSSKKMWKISQISHENFCVGVSLNNVGLKAWNVIKRDSNIAKFLRTTFFKEHLQWLLLEKSSNKYSSKKNMLYVQLISKTT